MSDDKKIEVGIIKHSWLDMSVSWFISIDGNKSGGEMYSKETAIESAKHTAALINGIYVDEVNETNELWT